MRRHPMGVSIPPLPGQWTHTPCTAVRFAQWRRGTRGCLGLSALRKSQANTAEAGRRDAARETAAKIIHGLQTLSTCITLCPAALCFLTPALCHGTEPNTVQYCTWSHSKNEKEIHHMRNVSQLTYILAIWLPCSANASTLIKHSSMIVRTS